jgi:pimeloyl-ACP methyl ester carboxylesterase
LTGGPPSHPQSRTRLRSLSEPSFTPFHRGGSGPPLVCVHGFTDTWRTWELVLPELERHHDVLAVTLPGHAGGPPLREPLGETTLAEAVEGAMDRAGFERAHILGNSLGGYIALQLAARGRAESVVALAPAGGWAKSDRSHRATLAHFTQMLDGLPGVLPHLDEILATPEGRRATTLFTTVRFEHIPVELLRHQTLGVAACSAARALIAQGLHEGWPLEPASVSCPVRFIWGVEDQLLRWPAAADRFREHWSDERDWIVLPQVGHCPQLDVPDRTAELVVSFTGARAR